MKPAGTSSLGDHIREIRTGPFGSSLHSAEYVTGGIPVVNPQHYRNGRIEPDISVTVDASTAERLRTFRLDSGDVVVARRGEMGRCAVIRSRESGWILGTGSVAIRVKESLYPDYLRYFLCSPSVVRDLSAASVGSTMANLNQRILLSLTCFVPVLSEQKRVVAAIETQFSRLDAAVGSLERAKANVKRARASVLKAAVEGRLVPTEAALARAEHRDYEPASTLLARILASRAVAREGVRRRGQGASTPGTSALPAAPEGWTWATVDQLASGEGRGLGDGPFGSNLKSCHYVEAGPRVVRLQNIGDGVFRDERAHITTERFEFLRKHEIRGGEIVIASLGETLPRACIVPNSVGRAIVKADCVRFVPSPMALPKYLCLAMNSQPVRERTTARIHGVGRPRLGLSGIREIALPLPPLAEQHRIVAEVDRRVSVLDALDATLDANLARCASLRQSILKRAFEGRLVPSVIDDPVAESGSAPPPSQVPLESAQ